MGQDLDKKIDSWREQLLDLSKRNKMISFKPTKTKSLPVYQNTPETVAKQLIDGKELQVLQRPEKEDDDDDGETEYVHHSKVDAAEHELVPGREPEAAETSLYRIRLNYEEIQREKGVPTLYMAAGFLEWSEKPTAESTITSPLILLPVTITEESLGEPDRHDYEITLAGAEPKINPALKKKLMSEFNIELPENKDINLDDLQETLDAIREATGGKPSWNVTEKLVLGIFDFSKYPLYKDLNRNREALHENHLIQAMNEGDPDLIDRPDGEIPDAEELDEKVTPQETFQVLDADSSQQRAIEAAKAGQSFVLQGPPGTGKSQTIANIIAEKLADGETVLFVSEKQAALNVVKDRLDDVGLGKFCLEAHGKKAGKKDVLDQIARERNRRSMPSPEERERDLDRLKEVRDELNRFGDLLQSVPGEMDKTVFEVEGILSDLDDAPRISGEFTDSLSFDDATFREAVDALKPLQNHPDQIKAYNESPWRYLTVESWGFDMREKFQDSIRQQEQVLEEMKDVIRQLNEQWGLDVDSLSDLRDAESFLDHAVDNPMPHAEPAVFVSGFEQHNKDMEELANMSIECAEKKDAIRDNYQESVFDIDAEEYHEDVEEFGLSRIIRPGYWSLKNEILEHARGGYSPNKDDLLDDLKILEEIEELEEEIEEFEWLQENLGNIYKGEETDWETVKEFWSWLKELKRMNDATEKLRSLGTEEGMEEAEESLEEVQSVLEEFEEALSFFEEIFDLDDLTYEGKPFEELSPQSLEGLLEELQDTSDTFDDWVDFTRLANEARDTLAETYLDHFLTEGHAPDQLISGFRRSFYRAWMQQVYEDHGLGEFSSRDMEQKLEEFRDLDKKQQYIARKEIQRRLIKQRPKMDLNNTGSSEQTFLDREINKERRIKPLRTIFTRTSDLITTLTPCFMMSPLSVAQHIPKGAIEFDCVIFDEASQVMPQDAVSSLIRADQAIIVGDSKQLPPTRFFQADVEEKEEVREDLDSILDEMDSLLPTEDLRWHYRSNDNALISFSNHKYYGNRLHTFPENNPEDPTGVEFEYVEEGVYDRGGSSTNVPEAERVVDKVEELVEEYGEKTIGVVAFSSAQEREIRDLIEERRRDNPALDSYIRDKEGLESFFVKRLEVVQGDERDIMLFSVGYGPDENGKITMNFGPLNHDGGERRLNVAVTRARDRVIVFSSLQPGDIDLSRTSATGVQHFKQYLEYAKHGEEVLSREDSTSDTLQFDSEFEEAVYNALTEAGLDVDTQVQSAGYSIDLAIKHPEQPGKYVLGIECDGAAYHHTKSARDRDRLRQLVLEDLGWTIHRIWSPDWLANKDREIESIQEKVEDLVEGEKDEHRLSTVDENDVEVEEVDLDEVEGAHQDVIEYEPYSPRSRRDSDFDDISNIALKNALSDVVKSEAPVESRDAYRWAVASWDISQVGSRIAREMNDLVRRSSEITEHNGVLWPSTPDGFDLRVRRNTQDHRREVDKIPQMEIAKGAYVVLESGYSMDRDDLVVETARLFGFSRAGSKIQERVDEAIDWLIQEGAVEQDNDLVAVEQDVDIDEVIFDAIY